MIQGFIVLLMVGIIIICIPSESPTEEIAHCFRYPLKGNWIVTQDFQDEHGNPVQNDKMGGYHLAEDVEAAPETPVYSTANGIVKYAKTDVGGYGGLIIIQHRTENGPVTSLYGHLSKQKGLKVVGEQEVSVGELIGYIAYDNEDGGEDWGPHLHFGIRKGVYDEAPICGKWPYVGYSRSCPGISHEQYHNMWYGPSDFIQDHDCSYGPSEFKPYFNDYITAHGGKSHIGHLVESVPISTEIGDNWCLTMHVEGGIIGDGILVYDYNEFGNVPLASQPYLINTTLSFTDVIFDSHFP